MTDVPSPEPDGLSPHLHIVTDALCELREVLGEGALSGMFAGFTAAIRHAAKHSKMGAVVLNVDPMSGVIAFVIVHDAEAAKRSLAGTLQNIDQAASQLATAIAKLTPPAPSQADPSPN